MLMECKCPCCGVGKKDKMTRVEEQGISTDIHGNIFYFTLVSYTCDRCGESGDFWQEQDNNYRNAKMQSELLKELN